MAQQPQGVTVATPNTPHHMSRLELESIGRILNAVEGAGELAQDYALNVARGSRPLTASTNLLEVFDKLKDIEGTEARMRAGLSQTLEARRVAGAHELARRKAGFTNPGGSIKQSLQNVAGYYRARDALDKVYNLGAEDEGVGDLIERMRKRVSTLIPAEQQAGIGPNSVELAGRSGTGLDLVQGPDKAVRRELLRSGFADPFIADEGFPERATLDEGFMESGQKGRRVAQARGRLLRETVGSSAEDAVNLVLKLDPDTYGQTYALKELLSRTVGGPLDDFVVELEGLSFLGDEDVASHNSRIAKKSSDALYNAIRKAKQSGGTTGLDIVKHLKPRESFVRIYDASDPEFGHAIVDLADLDPDDFGDKQVLAKLDDIAKGSSKDLNALVNAGKQEQRGLLSKAKKLKNEISKITGGGVLPGVRLPGTKRSPGLNYKSTHPFMRFGLPLGEIEFADDAFDIHDVESGEASKLRYRKNKIELGQTYDETYHAVKRGYYGLPDDLEDLPTKAFRGVKQEELQKAVRVIQESEDLKYHLLGEGEIARRYADRDPGVVRFVHRTFSAPDREIGRGALSSKYRFGDTADKVFRNIRGKAGIANSTSLARIVMDEGSMSSFERDVKGKVFRQGRGQMTLLGRQNRGYSSTYTYDGQHLFPEEAASARNRGERTYKKIQSPDKLQKPAETLLRDLKKLRALGLSPETFYLALQTASDNPTSTNSALGMLRIAGPAYEGKFTALDEKIKKGAVQTADDVATKFRKSLRAMVGPAAAATEGVLGESLSREIASTFASATSPQDLAERLQAVRRRILSGQVRAIRATYPEPELQRYHLRNMVQRFTDVTLPGADEALRKGESARMSSLRQLADEFGPQYGIKDATFLDDQRFLTATQKFGLRAGQGLGQYLDMGSKRAELLAYEARTLLKPRQDRTFRGYTVDDETAKQARKVLSVMKKRLSAIEGEQLAKEADALVLAGMQSDVEVGRRQFLGRVMKAAAQATPQTRAALEAAGAIQGYVDPAHVNVTREVANSQVLKGMLSFIRKFPGVP